MLSPLVYYFPYMIQASWPRQRICESSVGPRLGARAETRFAGGNVYLRVEGRRPQADDGGGSDCALLDGPLKVAERLRSSGEGDR